MSEAGRETEAEDGFSSFLLVFESNTCSDCGVTRAVSKACDCGAWTPRDDANVVVRRNLAQDLRESLDRPIAPSSPIEFGEALDVLVPWIEQLFEGLRQLGGDQPDASPLRVTVTAMLDLRDRIHAVPRHRPWLAVWDPMKGLVDQLLALAATELDACLAPDPDAVAALEPVGQRRIDDARTFIHKVDVRLTWWGIERTIRLPDSAVAAAGAAYEDTGAEGIVDLDRLGMARYERITGKPTGPTGIGVGLLLDFALIDRAFDEARFYEVAATTYRRLEAFRAGFVERVTDEGWRADLLEARRKFYDAQLKAELVLGNVDEGERRIEVGAVIELGAVVTEGVAPTLLGLVIGSDRSRKVARGRDYSNYLQAARQADLGALLTGFDDDIRRAHGHSDFVVGEQDVLLGKSQVRVEDPDLVDRVLAALESCAAMFASIDCALVEAGHPAAEDRLADFGLEDRLRMLLAASGVEPSRVDRRGDRMEVSGRVTNAVQVRPMSVVATLVPYLDPEIKRLTLRMKRRDASLVAEAALEPMRRFLEGEGLAKFAALIECLGRSTINGQPVFSRRYTRFALVQRLLDYRDASFEETELANSIFIGTARRLGDRELAEGFEAFRNGKRAQQAGQTWTQKKIFDRLLTYVSKPPGPPSDGGPPPA